MVRTWIQAGEDEKRREPNGRFARHRRYKVNDFQTLEAAFILFQKESLPWEALLIRSSYREAAVKDSFILSGKPGITPVTEFADFIS